MFPTPETTSLIKENSKKVGTLIPYTCKNTWPGVQDDAIAEKLRELPGFLGVSDVG